MTTATTLMGLSPLVFLSGAGTELYRGLGATTLMGLSPLVFLSGASTELYRGLGAIVLFGLAFTALVTLTFLPCLLVAWLRLVERFNKDRIAFQS